MSALVNENGELEARRAWNAAGCACRLLAKVQMDSKMAKQWIRHV